jgi:hypothetical protein
LTESPQYPIAAWQRPGWRAAVDSWVAERLAEHGLCVVGPADDRALPWALVARVPTDAGPVWFKACTVGVAHEVGIYELLQQRAPEHVLTPLAADRTAGWLLLPDGGRTLRVAEGGRTDLAAWERMLTEYAELQRSLEGHVDELLDVGVPDSRPEALPGMRQALLGDTDLLMVGHEGGLTPDQREELLAGSDRFAAACEALAAYGIAPSLQHDDLHDGNVFLPPDRSGPLRVFDWGDAVVGHPFGTLLVTLRVVAHIAELPYGSPELLRLRDAYLEPWTGEHDRADLLDAARLAVRVGGVSRADCYRRALLEASPEGRAEFGDAVPAWLLEQQEPTPLEP